jgi:hypothetical protein
MRRRRPVSKLNYRGRTAWIVVPDRAAGGSTGDQRGSPRRSTRRSSDCRRRPRRCGTGRVAGAVLPGFPGCQRRERSGRRTPQTSHGSASWDQRRPGRLPEAQLNHPRACGAGGADRGNGFPSPDSPSLRQLICCGQRQPMSGPPSARHATCGVHRGTWTPRLASSASALGVICPFPGAQEHGQDSLSCTWGQLRLSGTEGHLDQLALSRLCSGRISRALGGGHVPGHACRLGGDALDSSRASPADVGLASPHLTCLTK